MGGETTHEVGMGADLQQFMLCGKPLDFGAVLQQGIDVTQIRGIRLESPMKMMIFEDTPGSETGYNVYVSKSTIFIAPIGVDPREAYLDPRNPLVFTAHAPGYSDKVVFTIRTRQADDTYDARLPRGRMLVREAMKFLDSSHREPESGRSTIRIMEAEYVEPDTGGASDNYTEFMEAVERYKEEYFQIVGRRPHQADIERAYPEIARRMRVTQRTANP